MNNTPTTARDISEALYRSIQRDPNPRATVRHALPSEDHSSLLIDVADATGANGMRTFVVKAHEVDPPEGDDAEVHALAVLLARAAADTLGGGLTAVAAYLLNAGVTL